MVPSLVELQDSLTKVTYMILDVSKSIIIWPKPDDGIKDIRKGFPSKPNS